MQGLIFKCTGILQKARRVSFGVRSDVSFRRQRLLLMYVSKMRNVIVFVTLNANSIWYSVYTSIAHQLVHTGSHVLLPNVRCEKSQQLRLPVPLLKSIVQRCIRKKLNSTLCKSAGQQSRGHFLAVQSRRSHSFIIMYWDKWLDGTAAENETYITPSLRSEENRIDDSI